MRMGVFPGAIDCTWGLVVVDDAGIRLEAACSGSPVSRCEKGDLAVLLDPLEDRRRTAPTDLRSRAGAREPDLLPWTPAVQEPVTFFTHNGSPGVTTSSRSPGPVCQRAFAAALSARERVNAMTPPSGLAGGAVRFGLALHVGEVLYGNIGGGNRMDFTCIGPAVNLAARLEKLAGKLGRTIVTSGSRRGWRRQSHFTRKLENMIC
jgi:class 3 adenylate cyclase